MSYSTVQFGDCLEALRGTTSETADLVYLDPPFFTQRVHSLRTRDGRDVFSFDDNWPSLDAYLHYLRERILECRRVLKGTGSIVVHCDSTVSHRLRFILDELFNPRNFRDEVIWAYRRWSNGGKGLLNNHQKLLFYSKTDRYKFNTLYEPYSPTTNVDQILQSRTRDHRNKSIYARDVDGSVVAGSVKRGVPMSNVWSIPYLNPKAKERVGYPTQKPLILMERIVQLLTDSGDLVIDPFCGSGTTLVAAKLLDRNAFGIDVSEMAVRLSKDRLANTQRTKSRLLEVGERAYLTHSSEIRSLLSLLGATPVYRNRGIDGLIWGTNQELIAVRIQRDNEQLHDAAALLSAAAAKRRAAANLLFRTQLERPGDTVSFSSIRVVDHPQLTALRG